MSRVFFTSDLHFGHDNLIDKLRNTTTDENFNELKRNWNKVVHKKDKVFILGDVVFEKSAWVDRLLELNGQKVVILGNHDTPVVVKRLQELNIPVLGMFKYKGYMLSHAPIHPSELEHYRGNIHGHIHIKTSPEPHYLGCNYFNVNCELHNYTPVLFTDILVSFESEFTQELTRYG